MKKRSDKPSYSLVARPFDAATTFAGSKSINVNGYGGTYYVPKTPANIKFIQKRLGKGEMQEWRGKKRIFWLDRDIY